LAIAWNQRERKSAPEINVHIHRQCLSCGAPINTFNSEDTEQADLRGGRSPWFAGLEHVFRPPVSGDLRCDVLIVGCGITGALMAEQLTRQGLDVVIIDRELPGRGSTAASTSMLLWEIDRSLTELTAALWLRTRQAGLPGQF
jgi:siroheme synthase (precorrin-2 oxidase/ferrochelatase)